MKTDLDVRRVWRCPNCGYERRASGQRTTIRCRCGDRPFMKLVSEPKFHRPPNRPVDVYVQVDDLERSAPSLESAVGVEAVPADDVAEAVSIDNSQQVLVETAAASDDATTVDPATFVDAAERAAPVVAAGETEAVADDEASSDAPVVGEEIKVAETIREGPPLERPAAAKGDSESKPARKKSRSKRRRKRGGDPAK